MDQGVVGGKMTNEDMICTTTTTSPLCFFSFLFFFAVPIQSLSNRANETHTHMRWFLSFLKWYRTNGKDPFFSLNNSLTNEQTIQDKYLGVCVCVHLSLIIIIIIFRFLLLLLLFLAFLKNLLLFL